MTIELVREFEADATGGNATSLRMGRATSRHVAVMGLDYSGGFGGTYTWRLWIRDVLTGVQTDSASWDPNTYGQYWSDGTEYRLIGVAEGVLLALTQDAASSASPYVNKVSLRRITVNSSGIITGITAQTIETSVEPLINDIYWNAANWGLYEASPGKAMLHRNIVTSLLQPGVDVGGDGSLTMTFELYHVDATTGLTVSGPVTSWTLTRVWPISGSPVYPDARLAWYPFQDETDGRFRGTAVRAPSADTLPGLVQWDDIQLGAGSSVITNITTSGTQSFDHIGHPDTTGGTIGQVYDGSTVGRLLPSSATPSTTYPIYFDQAGFDHVTLGPASVGPIQFGMSGANYYVATASEPTVAIIPSALGSDTLFLGLAVTCGSYAVVMTSTGKVGVFGFGLIATEVEPALRLLQRGDSLGIEGSARLGGPTNVGNNPGTLQYNPAPRLTQGGNVFR